MCQPAFTATPLAPWQALLSDQSQVDQTRIPAPACEALIRTDRCV